MSPRGRLWSEKGHETRLPQYMVTPLARRSIQGAGPDKVGGKHVAVPYLPPARTSKWKFTAVADAVAGGYDRLLVPT